MNAGKRPSGDAERGSLTVELAVLAPVLVLFALLIVALAQVETLRAQVAGAARAAAEAAAQAPDAANAAAAARQAVPASLPSGGRGCAALAVTVDTTDFVPGGRVTVRVACQLSMATSAVPGFPGSVPVASTVSAPIDPYRVVG